MKNRSNLSISRKLLFFCVSYLITVQNSNFWNIIRNGSLCSILFIVWNVRFLILRNVMLKETGQAGMVLFNTCRIILCLIYKSCVCHLIYSVSINVQWYLQTWCLHICVLFRYHKYLHTKHCIAGYLCIVSDHLGNAGPF